MTLTPAGRDPGRLFVFFLYVVPEFQNSGAAICVMMRAGKPVPFYNRCGARQEMPVPAQQNKKGAFL